MTNSPINKDSREELLKTFFQSCVTGIRSFRATKPREWMEAKGLSYDELQIGFSSGQFSHRKSQSFKDKYVRIGILNPSTAAVREPHLKAYTCFGNYAIVFPLKNEKGIIINLFAIRIDTKTEKEEYLNQEGIYPGYPSPLTRRLYVTSTVMDAASLLQSKVMENRDAVTSLFNGQLLEQHVQAISKLKHLEEIIFIK
jgi:hypothetical protein